MGMGTEGGTSAALFEKSAQRLVESPVKREFLSTIMDIKLRFQAGLSCTPHFTMRYACMYWSQEYWVSE